VLCALAAGSLVVGEFHLILIGCLSAWDEQSELDRRLMALLDDWERQATPEGKSAAAATLRAAAREAASQAG
jgi:hypothetical protein